MIRIPRRLAELDWKPKDVSPFVIQDKPKQTSFLLAVESEDKEYDVVSVRVRWNKELNSFAVGTSSRVISWEEMPFLYWCRIK
jgi:hypothetical protein